MIEKLNDVGTGMLGFSRDDLLMVVDKINEVVDFLNQEARPEEHPGAIAVSDLLERMKATGKVKYWGMKADRPVAPLYVAGQTGPFVYETGDTVVTYEVVFPTAGIRYNNRVKEVRA
jgi:hypothetical protein